MEVGGYRHAPAALPPVKRLGTHCIQGWLCHEVGVDGCGKISPPLGFDPWTVKSGDQLDKNNSKMRNFYCLV
jgi:hypothetical protein